MRFLSMLLLSAGLVLGTAPSVLASGGAPAKDAKPADNYITVSTVGLPVIERGRLINYVFASVRINLKPGADVIKLREKEPFLRDALVRAAHRTPFNSADDQTRVDEARLKSTLLGEATRILGAGAISTIEVTRQEPRRTVGLRRAAVQTGRPAGH